MRQLLLLSLAFTVIHTGCNKNSDKADANGNFEAVEFLVSAENQGRLLLFDIEEGDELQAGQEVGVIDTVQLSLKIDQLNAGLQSVSANFVTIDAQIESSRVQCANIQRELDRVTRLLNDGAATEKQRDDLEGQLQLVESQIATYEANRKAVLAEKNSIMVQIDQVRDQIRRSTIANPVDGVLLQKYKQQGEIVFPGQNLYKIANLDYLILRAYISGDQLSEIAIGENVIVQIDSQEGIRELSGTVTWISSESEFTPKIIQTREERVNLVYAMKVKVNNDGQLKIGMPGEVVFEK